MQVVKEGAKRVSQENKLTYEIDKLSQYLRNTDLLHLDMVVAAKPQSVIII